MPHPFRLAIGGSPLLHGAAAVAARPMLALALAKVSAEWSALEWALSRLFVTTLDGVEDTALDAYNSIISRRIRLETISAMIIPGADGDACAEMDGVFAGIERLARERNLVVHASWCAAASRPDTLLRADDADRSRRLHAIDAKLRNRRAALVDSKAGRMSVEDLLRTQEQNRIPLGAPMLMQEYRLSCFNNLLTRLAAASARVDDLGQRHRSRVR